MALIIISLVGGLGLFIYGMNLMSRGIERVAGAKLRDILKNLTKNRFLGLIVGLFFTAVIQSSSAATVMTVSFVNSGLMTLSEATGIILGANIGTTVTAMLVAFKLSTIAPIIVFCGAIMANFIKEPFVRKLGDIVLGFGILFLGISSMSSAMGELKEMPAVSSVLANFTNPFLAVLLGLVITSVVQSSSVTVSIMVVMASQGLVDLPICMYAILGCNIGACTSAVLAGMSGGKNAKRTALIHLLFNIISTIILFILLELFSSQIVDIIHFVNGKNSTNFGRNVAWAHFLFKVFSVIILYPFMNLIIKLTYILVPGEDKDAAADENRHVLKFISDTLPNPSIAVYLATQEIYRMMHMAKDNLNLVTECLYTADAERVKQAEETEAYIDFLNIQISDYLVKINTAQLPIEDANRIAGYFHVVSCIERIGDYADNIREFTIQLAENKIRFSDDSVQELKNMMANINKMIDDAIEMFGAGDESHMNEIRELEDQVDKMDETYTKQHIERLTKGLCSAQAGIYFSDTVSALERCADHAINVAFALNESRKGKKI